VREQILKLVIIDSKREIFDQRERLDLKKISTSNKMTVMSMIDWNKIDLKEVRKRWAKRRRRKKEGR